MIVGFVVEKWLNEKKNICLVDWILGLRHMKATNTRPHKDTWMSTIISL